MNRTVRTPLAASVMALLMVFAAPFPCAVAGSGEVEPGAFVERLVADVTNNLAGDAAQGERRDQFEQMSRRYLALDKITQFITGAHWSQATAEEQRAFRKAFRELLRARFLPVLVRADEARFDVAGSRRVKAGLWQVALHVRRPGPKADSTRVGLRVMQTEAGMRVTDVVTRGVSLGVTLREEYTTFLERHDGDLKALTRRVRQRARDLEG